MSNSRTILSRPRTRVYDANYNIGESYYKSAIDRLDRKYSGRPLTPPREREPSSVAAEIAERHASAFADEDIGASRKRAGKFITEENIFDTRSGRFPRRDDLENGDDDETSSALRRIRANKKISLIDDVDLESTSNNLKTYRMLDRSEKILNAVGINENSRRALDEEVSYKRRSLNASAAAESDGLTLEKWTPIASTPVEDRNSAAALRARQSKERLTDIEDEMAALAEKQAARERRVARLKALVAETESDEVADVTEVSVSSRKEKKSVRF